jgi:hypothetical protein
MYSLVRCETDLSFRIPQFDEPDVIQRKLPRVEYALYGRYARCGLKAARMGDACDGPLISRGSKFGTQAHAAQCSRAL